VGNVPDGDYELSLYAKCVSSGMASAPPGLDNYRSAIIPGSIDRTVPVQFGAAKPLTTDYQPGDEISVSFNEDINCNPPFVFDVYFDLFETTTNQTLVVIDPIVIDCDQRTINIAFSPSANVSLRLFHSEKITY
jgi:hypothetical protein